MEDRNIGKATMVISLRGRHSTNSFSHAFDKILDVDDAEIIQVINRGLENNTATTVYIKKIAFKQNSVFGQFLTDGPDPSNFSSVLTLDVLYKVDF